LTAEAIAVVLSVAILAAAALKGLAMVLAFKAKKLEHAPIAHLEQRMAELEGRILSGAMRR